ncbi:unnamed protein product [Notodromas monacha]|uniref:Rho-GAP domain-containing protein n=1 Tax=Notodromas monacha TaxID=399045 RepID=A0A7R9GEF5_9CRUS|nr:unnamed protein product [Notodromas monacha]CAG0918217.1 unnamed protein product [Notodromas monacha]
MLLQEKLKAEGALPDKDATVHDVVAVLRSLLKELPEPVVPKYHTSLMKRCMRRSDAVGVLRTAMLLPETHLAVLCLLCDLFAGIAANAHVSHMDSKCLAIVMAPTLLYQEKLGGSETELKVVYPAILQTFIDNSEKLGIIPVKTSGGEMPKLVSLTELDVVKSTRRDRRSKSVTRTIAKMKNWMQQRRDDDAEDPESNGPQFERNSRISASAMSERKRKKKRFLTPTRDPVGQSKFYDDSDDGAPVAEKQPKLMPGSERMSRREIWVELQKKEDLPVPANVETESVLLEDNDPLTPQANSVQKAFADTWLRSESLKAELSPMLTNRSRKGRSPSQRRIDRRRSASLGTEAANNMENLSLKTPQAPVIRTPLAPLSQGRFHSLRRNKPNTVSNGLPTTFRSAVRATPLRALVLTENDDDTPEKPLESKRLSFVKPFDVSEIVKPNPELDKETAENQATAFMELARESWIPAQDVFGLPGGSAGKKRRHRRRHAKDPRRVMTAVIDSSALQGVRLKQRKSVSSSQIPLKPICSPSAGVWTVESIEFRVPKAPSTPADLHKRCDSGQRESRKRMAAERWTPGSAYFESGAAMTQSERKATVRDSVARIREENVGKVRELAQRYDTDVKRRESFVAPLPRTLFH